LEHGGDVRCFITDNHRPMHLANIHSNHNVVVLNDGSISSEDIPSDASDLSFDDTQSSSSSDDSEDDDDDRGGQDSSQVV
jgi:hypothetical protein